MPTTIHAFWSHSRATQDAGGADLHRLMQSTLSDPMSLHGELRIFRDSDTQYGIHGGASWPRTLVGAVARSTLFFWVQSPRWLRAGSVCQFELEAFRDRVDRIAREFVRPFSAAAAEPILDALLIPIRLINMEPADWAQIDEGVRGGFEAEWQRRQLLPWLDFPRLRQRAVGATDDYGASCMAAAAPIAKRFAAALDALGVDGRQLGAFIEGDRVDFEQCWLAELDRRLQRSVTHEPPTETDVAAQRHLAGRMTDGVTQKEDVLLRISMVLVPYASPGQGYWAAASPLPNRLAPALAGCLADRSALRPGPDGFLRCTAPAVPLLEAVLDEAGLRIPDALQAARLAAIFGGGREAASRLGFQALPTDFWQRAVNGELVGSTGCEFGRTLLLTAPLA